MANFTVDREAIDTFLQDVGDANYELVATGSSLNGAVQVHIIKETKILGEKTRTEVRGASEGARMDGGQRTSYDNALNAMRGGDVLRACTLLVNSYFSQVELRPLRAVDVVKPGSVFGSNWEANPLFETVEPLVWRQDAQSGVWGGVRPGAGRPRVRITLDSEAAKILAVYLDTHPNSSANEVVSALVKQL